MTDPRARDVPSSHAREAPESVAELPLPSHVRVWVGGRWRRGWLIGRSHESDGWIGRVQYDDDRGHEVTEDLPAEHIAPA